MNAAEAEKKLRAAATAWEGGDAAGARHLLETVVAAGHSNVQVLLFLAQACRLTGDREAEEQALDNLLAGGRSIRALIMKGDCRAWRGDARAAVDFYQAAHRSAAASTNPIPADLAAELKRTEASITEASRQYRDFVDNLLAEEGLTGDRPSRRFRHSIDILNGERQIYPQQPTGYYLPELPAIQFFEAASFPWAEAVEAATPAIKAELEAVLVDSAALEPFIKSNRHAPPEEGHSLTNNPDWSAFQFWERGTQIEANTQRCPQTIAALAAVPMPAIPKVAPSIFFSVLRAGARIPAHHGLMNTRLVCHLPLIVPAQCGIRVGNETRTWEEGRLMIFDDSIEHEAWNESGQDRIVLIFETWRPDLSEEERRAVTTLFASRDGFEGRLQSH